MPKAKIAVTVDDRLLATLDRHVVQGEFANRSQAIEQAIGHLIARLAHTRLAAECARLDPTAEAAFAEEGRDDPWPAY